MRLIHLLLTGLLFIGAPLAGLAAGGNTSIRAISFVASNERGATDPRLAPYQDVLRANLRFESFKFVSESSASVSAGGTATISAAGGRIELEGSKSGAVKVRRNGVELTLSPGRPAVFMGGPAGNGGVSGVIVMAQ